MVEFIMVYSSIEERKEYRESIVHSRPTGIESLFLFFLEDMIYCDCNPHKGETLIEIKNRLLRTAERHERRGKRDIVWFEE